MATAEDRMRRFCLLLTAAGEGELKGVRSLEPVGGADGAAVTYCFELKCIKCGEITSKDICLRPADAEILVPTTSPCSYRVRRSGAARDVRQQCYPTCRNSAHVVRKCKGCGLLGSVEIIPGSRGVLLKGIQVLSILECSGYTPRFRPGPNWTLTNVTGVEFQVILNGEYFVGRDGTNDSNLIIKGEFLLQECDTSGGERAK